MGILDRSSVFIQAIKDDFALYEVCSRLIEEGFKRIDIFTPDEYWSGKPVLESGKAEIADVISRLAKNYGGITLTWEVTPVGCHRQPGRSRIEVETHYRNACLDTMRKSGVEHIFIADGDELWRRGLLARLVEYIEKASPPAVNLGMVPTIGLPGWAVGDAQDGATVYLGPNVKLACCRSPDSDVRTFREIRGIIHFTATRRTMQEIIDKHRESGHYDDPSYDFEGWIANCLPHIHNGMRNVHMYRPYNPWPIVRPFTPEEIADIPESLHKYLHFGQTES